MVGRLLSDCELDVLFALWRVLVVNSLRVRHDQCEAADVPGVIGQCSLTQVVLLEFEDFLGPLVVQDEMVVPVKSLNNNRLLWLLINDIWKQL